MSGTPTTDKPAGALTDGKVVAPITLKKLVKDFVADALIAVSAAVLALNSPITPDVLGDQTAQVAIAFAVVTAIGGALYRSVLRWATSPD